MSDPTTQSNYIDIQSEHVSLTWDIDWEKKVISGSATHDLRVNKDGVAEIMLVIVVHAIVCLTMF